MQLLHRKDFMPLNIIAFVIVTEKMYSFFALCFLFSSPGSQIYIHKNVKIWKSSNSTIVNFSISISTTHQWVKGIDENITVPTNNITGNG
jgi:hypothetical protein